MDNYPPKDGKGQSYLKRQIKALEKADRIYLSAADVAQLALIQNIYKDKDLLNNQTCRVVDRVIWNQIYLPTLVLFQYH